METRHTSTFTTLEIDPRAFDDIKDRLKTAGALWDYLDTETSMVAPNIEDNRERIIFGNVALVEEPACCALCRLNYAVQEYFSAWKWCRARGISLIAMLRTIVLAYTRTDAPE